MVSGCGYVSQDEGMSLLMPYLFSQDWNLTYGLYTKYIKPLNNQQPALLTQEIMDVQGATRGDPAESEEALPAD